MEPSMEDPSGSCGRSFGVPETAIAPEAVLAMGRGEGRGTLEAALAADGWSVTLLDNGWTLLDHLAGARLSGLAWRPPALIVLEVAIPGPRLAVLFDHLRGLFPDLPVLLVGRRATHDGQALLRPPFGSTQVRRAVRQAVGPSCLG